MHPNDNTHFSVCQPFFGKFSKFFWKTSCIFGITVVKYHYKEVTIVLTRAERIKMLIDESGKSYMELEKMTGIKKSSLQRYATGETTKIPLDVIEKLSKTFCVSQKYLMGWSEDKENSPEENALTEGEKEWLDLYRSLPEASRLQLSRSLKAFEMLPEHLQTVALQEFTLQMLQAKLNDQ
jgi:transcriptional regulator with XRE-family HTH domain